jgi:mannose-6-phosphate isomerase-like protein (cupin superfamily)
LNDYILLIFLKNGDYHRHHHDADDEFFYVVDGRLLIDLEPRSDGVTPGRVIELHPREAMVVPKGVEHRTRAPERTVILMVETAAIVPTGS